MLDGLDNGPSDGWGWAIQNMDESLGHSAVLPRDDAEVPEL